METHKKRVTAFVILAVILGIYLILSFPQIRHDSQTAFVLFAPDRLVADPFRGRVLGTHVLQTEHGEMILKNSARIIAGGGRIIQMGLENFETGLVSHNLVVGGVEIPQNVSIWFAPSRQIGTLNLRWQEVVLSGVSFEVGLIHINSPRYSGDINMDFFQAGYITLSDGTQVGGQQGRGLDMYTDEQQWRISGGRTFVKRQGEDEFIEYRSITFGANWGEFIEGER